MASKNPLKKFFRSTVVQTKKDIKDIKKLSDAAARAEKYEVLNEALNEVYKDGKPKGFNYNIVPLGMGPVDRSSPARASLRRPARMLSRLNADDDAQTRAAGLWQ